jgi:hypothetical protein
MSINRIIEGTITLILVFLVLSNAQGFDTVASAIGNVYSNAVRTLQGR